MNIVENIRRIGMFMIVAQTVIHFASGKQYEKYLKIIAGVLILLQFISPFVSSSEDFAAQWQTEVEQMMKQMGEQDDVWQEIPSAVSSVETIVLRQIEEEMKSRMNEIVSDYDCEVAGVEIDLEQTKGGLGLGADDRDRSWNFHRVKVTLQRRSTTELSDAHARNTYGGETIRIEEITVGQREESDAIQQEERDTETQAYQHLFAQALGIAEDRVEVAYRGEW